MPHQSLASLGMIDSAIGDVIEVPQSSADQKAVKLASDRKDVNDQLDECERGVNDINKRLTDNAVKDKEHREN